MATLLQLSPRPAIAGHKPEIALPDAPAVAVDTPTATQPIQQQTTEKAPPAGPMRQAPRLAKYIGPDQQTAPLSAKEKLELSGREQIHPYAFATQFLAAGWEQLLDSNPQYGTDSGAFGERLGAAAILQNSRALLADGVAPILFHQDPRYYRKGSGKIAKRILYAASRVAIIRTDAGNNAPNYSELTGNAAATALTMTYYPAVSATWPKTAKGYGISLVEGALGNQVHEFLPDLKRLLFHRGHN